MKQFFTLATLFCIGMVLSVHVYGGGFQVNFDAGNYSLNESEQKAIEAYNLAYESLRLLTEGESIYGYNEQAHDMAIAAQQRAEDAREDANHAVNNYFNASEYRAAAEEALILADYVFLESSGHQIMNSLTKPIINEQLIDKQLLEELLKELSKEKLNEQSKEPLIEEATMDKNTNAYTEVENSTAVSSVFEFNIFSSDITKGFIAGVFASILCYGIKRKRQR